MGTVIKEFKKPDLNAPRYRQTRLGVLNADLLDRFREKFPKYKDKTNDELKEIIKVYNTNIWNTVLNYRDGAEMPEGLGYLFIGTCPSPQKYNTDFKVSLVNDTRLKHRNFESDNYLAKIFYTNYANKYKFDHRQIWQFVGIRDFKRAVKPAFRENWMNYVKVERFQQIWKIYDKAMKKTYMKERKDEIPDNYNEFAI